MPWTRDIPTAPLEPHDRWFWPDGADQPRTVRLEVDSEYPDEAFRELEAINDQHPVGDPAGGEAYCAWEKRWGSQRRFFLTVPWDYEGGHIPIPNDRPGLWPEPLTWEPRE